MATNWQRVSEIAIGVRKWAERVAARENLPDDLCGLCAVASGRLHKELREAGFRSVLACSNDHCFVLLEGRVVDVTATQFYDWRDHPVLIEKLASLRVARFSSWSICSTSTTRRGMRKFQLEEGWPTGLTVASPTIAGA